MGIKLLQHSDRSTIRKIELMASANARGIVDPFVLPLEKEAGVLIALETIPQKGAMPAAPFDVRLIDQHSYDQFEGCGLTRQPAQKSYAFIKYANVPIHPVFCGDRLTMHVSNLSAGARVKIVLFYGADDLVGR